MRICDHCGGEVVEKWIGDEGISVCLDCRAIEGGDTEEFDNWIKTHEPRQTSIEDLDQMVEARRVNRRKHEV